MKLREPEQDILIAIILPWLLTILIVGFLMCRHWGSGW
jgi:hypothetical protein